MLHAFLEGLLSILSLKPFLLMLLGAGIGFWVGILPGLGGATAMALLLPFIYKMTPLEAFPFLLGMHSVVQTTGDITSILFGVPGESTTVAIILDGHAMAKKGEPGRALGVGLTAALMSAIIGAGALALAVPIVRPLVLALGSPEMFMVIILGLTCISSLSGRQERGLLLGLMCAAAGFLLSLVGQDRQAGVLRYTFDQLYLWEGVPFVPAIVGLFAIPEVIDTAITGASRGDAIPMGDLRKGVWKGVKDCFRHFFLLVRCSAIGTFIGIMPGIGGAVAQWIAYAHAAQGAKTPEEADGFGKGDVRGIIGPAAANSKEGGALITTLAFGMPGSASMAILLGGFFILGLVPGPDMLTKHLPLTFSLVWTIVLANLAVVLVSYLFLDKIAGLTLIRPNLLIPFILLLVFIGGYTSSNSMADLVVTLLSGVVGYVMVRCGLPRPTFILGFVLGKLAETYFYSAYLRYDLGFFLRPKVLVILVLAVVAAVWPLIQQRRMQARGGTT